jgi:uridylate kinase
MKRRVLLKLSGETFGSGSFGIDTIVVRDIAGQIANATKKGIQVAIVIGGGNFFRGKELSKNGVNREKADYMGMLGTVINCLILQDFLEKKGINTRTQTAIPMAQIAEAYMPLRAIKAMNDGGVVIFGAGAGMPYFSTDTVAAQRALETHCDELLIAKNGTDGVYSGDPNKYKNVKKYTKLTYDEALKKNLTVVDAAAFSLCKDNNLNMLVFAISGKNNVYNALMGKNIGTLVVN